MKFLKWLIGGGNLKYRVIPVANVWMVQVHGGGTGWFWYFVGWHQFKEYAVSWAKYEAHQCGGTFIGVIK